MKKVKITLHGTIVYSAHRTFEIEVAEDAALRLMAPSMLNDLADLDQVPWVFGKEGYLEPTDYSIDEE